MITRFIHFHSVPRKIFKIPISAILLMFFTSDGVRGEAAGRAGRGVGMRSVQILPLVFVYSIKIDIKKKQGKLSQCIIYPLHKQGFHLECPHYCLYSNSTSSYSYSNIYTIFRKERHIFPIMPCCIMLRGAALIN